MPGPTFLRGAHVDLCPIEEEDLPFVQRMVNDPRVRATLQVSEPKNREQEREWLESLDERDGDTLLVVADGEPVGTAGFGNGVATWGTAEVGYSIAHEHWGNGYASEAVALLTRHAFEERRLAKLTATVYAHNPASMRVLEKAGWHEECVHEREAFVDVSDVVSEARRTSSGGGERVDCHRFVAFADDWAPTDERVRAALEAGGTGQSD